MGCLLCFQVREGLEQISSFLSAHAREVVFLDFNHFYGVQNLHHEKLVSMLRDVFGEKLAPVVFAQEVRYSTVQTNETPSISVLPQEHMVITLAPQPYGPGGS